MSYKKDIEIAQCFFNMLKSKGFKVVENTEVYCDDGVSYQLINDSGEVFCEFDFIDGNFYRISGFIDGHWKDEIDGKKY